MSERAENVAVNKLGKKKTELALVFWLSIRLTWWIKKGEPFAVYFLKLSSSLNLCSVCPLLSPLHSADVDNDNGDDDDDDDDDKDVNDRDDDGDSDMIMMTIFKWWLGLLY